MSDYAMKKKSVSHLIASFTIAAAGLGLGGCASFNTNVDPNNCTAQNISLMRIPFIMEIGGQGRASFKKTCEEGFNIGAIPMLGQKPDGTLAPASIIIFHKIYFEELLVALQNKIDNTLPDDIKIDPEIIRLTEIKTFADYFLGSLSGGRLNATMLKTMYDMKFTNPDLVNLDGTLKPIEEKKSIPEERFRCIGGGIIRRCSPN